MIKKRWKFLRLVDGKIKSNSGNCEWEIGEWKHEDRINMCNTGFHCSKTAWQAFSFVHGEVLAEVEVKGKYDIQDDKEVYTDMQILKAYKWQKKDSVALSIYSSGLVLKNFEKEFPNDKRPREAIEAAKVWLKNPTKRNESAARRGMRRVRRRMRRGVRRGVRRGMRRVQRGVRRRVRRGVRRVRRGVRRRVRRVYLKK